jgi:hypothetical protein
MGWLKLQIKSYNQPVPEFFYFIKHTMFMGPQRKLAYNGTSPQRVISITGDYTTSTTDLAWNKGTSSPGTPMTSGNIIMYLRPGNPLPTTTTAFQTNTVDHEVGHSCFLWHHVYIRRPSCTMRLRYSGLGLEPFSSKFVRNFCDANYHPKVPSHIPCKTRTKIK